MNSKLIKFGVCVDNNDPTGNHRIRVLLLDDEISTLNKSLNVTNLINQRDLTNQKKLGDSFYDKWFTGQTNKVDDPYLVNPFLPININNIPKIGELVKIIQYDINDDNGYSEYIGPATKEVKNLYFEKFTTSEKNRNHSQNLTKSENKKTQPNKNNYNISGRKDSLIEFLDDGVLTSAGKYKKNENGLNDNLAFNLIKRFSSEQKVIERSETITQTPTVPINHIVEYIINEYNNEFRLNLFIYNTSSLVNNNNYSPRFNYLDNSQIELSIEAKSPNINNLINFTQKLLNKLDENQIGLNLETETTVDNVTYTVTDIRKPINGINVRGEQFIDLGLFLIRIKPDLLTTEKSEDENKFIDSFSDDLRPFNKLPKSRVVTRNFKELQPIRNVGESYNISYSTFNMLLNDNPRLKSLINDEGFTQLDILTELLDLTQPVVRGYELANLLLKLINIIETHGHSTTGPNTINEGVKNDISDIKNILLTILDKNIKNSNPLVNEKIRIS